MMHKMYKHRMRVVYYDIGLPRLFFILYSFLPQPLPCNNILTTSLRQKEQQQQESRRRKLDPKWELSILNLQNLFRPFLFILWMCDYLLFLNNLKCKFQVLFLAFTNFSSQIFAS